GGEDDFGRPALGPQVLPGTYTVRLSSGGRTYAQPLRVVLDPRSTATPGELQKQFELSISIWRDLGRAADLTAEGAKLLRLLTERGELDSVLRGHMCYCEYLHPDVAAHCDSGQLLGN